MSKESVHKWLAAKRKANKGRLGRLGSYQSSKYKAIVLTIDGKKVEFDRYEYKEYIANIQAKKLEAKDTQKRFDPLTGEPLE